jgi:signal transduction histidine kinase
MTALDHAPAAPRRERDVIEEFHRDVALGKPWPASLERAFEALAGGMSLTSLRFAPAAGSDLPAVAWQPGRRAPHAASAVVPVAVRGDRIGTLLAHRAARCSFSAGEYEVLQGLAASVAVAERESRARRSERERIADTLHDDIAPMLFIARLLLEGRTDERAARAAELLERSERALRDVVSSLSAPIELADQVAALSERYEIPVSFASTVATLDAGIEQVLARVVHEAISNAVKHCVSQKIAVRLDRERGRLVLAVVNDGMPREHASVAGGRGLASLRRELRRSGGDIEFALNPAGGARLHAWVPAR